MDVDLGERINQFLAMGTDALSAAQLAAHIEHTLLKADATSADIERLCAEARHFGFRCVCVNGSHVEHARSLLEDTNIQVVAVVGFPLGAMAGDVKRFEAEAAIDDGAHEIDMVMNIGHLKDARDAVILRELRDVVESADERPVKIILETGLLDGEQKIRACQLVLESGAHFVKTSTGFGPGGATVEDVRLLRATVGPKFGVKASGGIRDLETASKMINAGADRLGTSSSVAIVQDLLRTSKPA
ncbi:MAG TPA: deoxyribose-phosphate aldolase [Verrucomicrobiae bacterium]|nr:deoxyribose-phosphate aldolase [Verrucomicrobiae bacterium]